MEAGEDDRDARSRRQAHRYPRKLDPHRLDDRRQRRQGQRRRARRDGALGLPDLRLLLRHVHRQQHELFSTRRSDWRCRGTARCSRPTPAAQELFAAASRRIVELAKRHYLGGGRLDPPRAASPPSRRHRGRDGAGHRDGRPRPTPCSTSWPSPMRPGSASRWRTSIGSLRRVPNICKVASPSGRTTMSRTCTAPPASLTILGELDRAGLLHRDVTHGARADAGRRHRRPRPPPRGRPHRGQDERALAAPGGVACQGCLLTR